MTSVAPTDRGAPAAGPGASAETRLARLLQRLLDAAATSLAAGDLEPARSTAEEVRAVATRVGERLASDGELRARIDGLAFRIR